jgi:hypothetical protein
MFCLKNCQNRSTGNLEKKQTASFLNVIIISLSLNKKEQRKKLKPAKSNMIEKRNIYAEKLRNQHSCSSTFEPNFRFKLLTGKCIYGLSTYRKHSLSKILSRA